MFSHCSIGIRTEEDFRFVLISSLTSSCLISIKNFLDFFTFPYIGSLENNAIIHKEGVVNNNRIVGLP